MMSKVKNSITAVTFILSLIISINSMDLFQVKFVENNDSRLIATSNSNYAISSPKLLTKNWRAISMNGDQALVLTATGNEKLYISKTQLGADGLAFVEQLRDGIAASSNSGYTHVSTASGGAGSGGSNSFMMSSSQGSSSSYSSSSSTSSSNFQQSGNEMSFSAKDENNFSVSKSNLPLDWSRVFFNNDLVTIIYKNGEVKMLSSTVMSPDELAIVEQLKRDVADLRRHQADQFANTMSHSMDMVSNVFNNIMGQFPKPPDYQSAVGNMFGDNFPFGPNNSPFSGASGWPFGGAASSGGGGAAFAFAGRR